MNKKARFPFLFFLLLCLTSFGQLDKYNYKSKLEPNSKLIVKDYNSTLEKLKGGKCIYKIYYPENKMITTMVTFKSRKSGIKDGLSYNQTDAGELISKGHYKENKKVGFWIENNWEGNYKNDLREGKWILKENELVLQKEEYLAGQLHGDASIYDTLGNLIIQTVYAEGQLIEEKIDSSFVHAFVDSRFVGCDSTLSEEALKECSTQKYLSFIYANIKYPKKARKQGISGAALVELTIENDGSISKVHLIRGLSIDIKNEIIRVVNLMPDWIPATKDGVPIMSKKRFPVKFSLR